MTDKDGNVTSFSLKEAKSSPAAWGTDLTFKYEVAHSTPGRDGTRLTQDLELTFDAQGWHAKMTITECKGKNPDEVLAKMSSWLRRMADGVDARVSSPIPL